MGEVTNLLQNWAGGDRSALDALIPLVRSELRQLAGAYMARERPGHILQPTALVNEAFLRLVEQGQAAPQNRAHFLGIAARLMRQVLVDYARTQTAAKRGGNARQVTMDEGLSFSTERWEELLDLDSAVEELAEKDPRKARVIELRFFGGLDVAETAALLAVSENTVIRDFSLARAWLMRRLDHSSSPP